LIIENAATCLSCGDRIFSKHRHDFVTCSCGAISVDGGQEYLRRVGTLTPGSYVNHSWELPDDLYRACADAVEEAKETNRNKFGIANAVMRKLREAGKIVADHEQRILAHNPRMDEIMVEEADGTINRYKKVNEDE
jgi:HD-like signal output (HDOD) protein